MAGSGQLRAASELTGAEPPEAMVTPDHRFISFDGGEHYMSTAKSPPPPAPQA
jgi:hypothetical protein